MTEKQKYYVTTPIYYVNGEPHIGHVYTTTLADCITLYQRYKGVEGYMLTGCDEHGLKVQTTAEKNGYTPKEWCDLTAKKFLDCFKEFNLTNYNRFIRTTDEDHIETAQHLWKVLSDKGFIYKARYEGWYNVSDECFVTEQNLKDGVDKDGNPCKVTVDGDVPCVFSSEDNYMFRLTAFRDELLAFYAAHPDAIYPAYRQAEIVRFIETGLQDLSISRPKAKIHWGIPVPGDAEHTMYVWIDALANYLTGAGWPRAGPGACRWPADVHILGKDIIRFHCVYWPAFLLGAGLALPRRWFVHGWWIAPDARKIGKSLGNASSPQAMARTFGVDALRYYMLSEASGEADAVITDQLVATKLNADLCNALGNLLMRCVGAKILPEQRAPQGDAVEGLVQGRAEGANGAAALRLRESANALYGAVDGHMEGLHTKDALLAIFAHVYEINQFLQNAQPWVLVKKNPAEHGVVMYTAIECLRIAGTLLLPFLTTKAPVLLQQLGVPREMWVISAENLSFGKLPRGTPVGEGEKEILFQRYESPEEKEAKDAKEKQKEKPKPVELPPAVSAFAKCDLRVTRVKTCAPVPDSDKLLLMTLDCGELGERTFVAGVQAYYKPEELIGRKIVTIMNLKPRKMCGGSITSEAMLFAGSQGEGDARTLKLCFPDETVEVGTRVEVEGIEALPEAAGDPKKNFDKVLKVLAAKDGAMCLEEKYFLTVSGKRISIDMPDGTNLG